MNDNKFTIGLLLGLLLGGGAVFLLGTRTGKNILKIFSDQGLDGLLNLLEEYNFDELEEMEEVPEEDVVGHQPEVQAPKKHFFRRIKK
jgi:hypothetical protein